jgi:uncharacterized protein YciI
VEAAPAPAVEPAPAPAPSGYTLVLIKTGPRSGQLPKEENDAAFAGHFANMQRMSETRQLVVAGPYGERRHDNALRGVFVMASAERAQAAAWAATDPATQAGVFVQEHHALVTDAPFVRALENGLARRAQNLAAGRPAEEGEKMRSYVLLTAEHFDLAERELRPLLDPAGGVYFLARLDDSRAFALLDAETQTEAAERFAPQLAELGAHTLDEWYSSAELMRLVEPGY